MVEIPMKLGALKNFKKGTPFRECPWIPDEALAQPDQFGGYRYLYAADFSAYYMRFHFGMDKTDEEKATPFNSIWKKMGNHRWPPLLKGLAFIEDYEFPEATNVIGGGEAGVATSPKNYVRELYIAEVNEGSRFLLDEFLSPTPYGMGRTPVPQSGRVSYMINGVRGAFEECWHDDIEIPSTSSATATLIGSSESVGDSRIPGQFFPRTNFRRRRPYILTVDQDLTPGGYHYQRLRVFPPRQPRLTTE